MDQLRVAVIIYSSFFAFGELLDILPILDSSVRWLLCILQNPPDRANTNGSEDTLFATQNLNTGE